MINRTTFPSLALIDILLSLPPASKAIISGPVGLMMAFSYTNNTESSTFLGFQMVQAYIKNNG